MLVIRRRIDKWGVAEVDVRKMGTDSIQISLPGQQDPEQAKELIGTTAQLEFRMVDEKSPFFSELVAKQPAPGGLGHHAGAAQRLRRSSRATIARRCSPTPRQGVRADRQVLLQCVSDRRRRRAPATATSPTWSRRHVPAHR